METADWADEADCLNSEQRIYQFKISMIRADPWLNNVRRKE